MSWTKITLTQEQVANGTLGQIQDAFAVLFTAAGGPKDAAMFGRSKLDARIAGRFDENDSDDDEYQTLYFSPEASALAARLISQFRGTPCTQPGHCALLVGVQGAFRLLKG